MFKIFVLLAPIVCFHIFSEVKVTEWPPIGKIAAHSAYDMVSWYKYLIVSLVFPTSVFGVVIFFLIVPFPDLCLFEILFSQKQNGPRALSDPLLGLYTLTCLLV